MSITPGGHPPYTDTSGSDISPAEILESALWRIFGRVTAKQIIQAKQAAERYGRDMAHDQIRETITRRRAAQVLGGHLPADLDRKISDALYGGDR